MQQHCNDAADIKLNSAEEEGAEGEEEALAAEDDDHPGAVKIRPVQTITGCTSSSRGLDAGRAKSIWRFHREA